MQLKCYGKIQLFFTNKFEKLKWKIENEIIFESFNYQESKKENLSNFYI